MLFFSVDSPSAVSLRFLLRMTVTFNMVAMLTKEASFIMRSLGSSG